MFVGTTRNPVTVIILSIVTCGIYGLFWLYTTSTDLNNVLEEERINPVLMIVLSFVTCGIAMLYWMYQIDKAVADVCAKNSVQYSSNFIIWLILYFVSGVGTIVAEYQVQTAMNSVWEARKNGSNFDGQTL